MFEIHKGIPIPDQKRSPGRAEKYPFSALEPGDCFTVPLGLSAPGPSVRGEHRVQYSRLRSLASHRGKRLGREFTIRMIEGVGYRIWRTA